MKILNFDSESCREAAVRWNAKLAVGTLTPSEWDEFDNWMSNPEHAAELRRSMVVWQRLDEFATAHEIIAQRADALNTLRRAGRFSWARPYYRTWHVGAAVAASVLCGILSINYMGADPTVAIESSRTASRDVSLPDGSTVTLEPDSRIAFDSTAHSRSVTLLAGGAHFHIANGGLAPFVITTGCCTIRADARNVSLVLGSGRGMLSASNGRAYVLDAADANGVVMAEVAGGQHASFAMERRAGMPLVQSDFSLALGGFAFAQTFGGALLSTFLGNSPSFQTK